MKELKKLNKYLYKYRYKLLAGLLITIVSRIFSLVTPRLVGDSITQGYGMAYEDIYWVKLKNLYDLTKKNNKCLWTTYFPKCKKIFKWMYSNRMDLFVW